MTQTSVAPGPVDVSANGGYMSALLSLPNELRHEIYKAYFSLTWPGLHHGNNSGSRIRKKDSNEVKAASQILLVCRLLYEEAFPYFWKLATVYITQPLKFAHQFLLYLEPSQRRQLKTIKFTTTSIPRPAIVAQIPPPEALTADIIQASRFRHLLTVFKTYPELSNIDALTMVCRRPCRARGR